VRSSDIEFVNGGVETGLPLEAVHAWRPSGFLFQGEMHALVGLPVPCSLRTNVPATVPAQGGGEATLCFNHIAPYAAHPQSITEAIQVLASGSDQTRYGIQPLSRSARATSAGCAVADAEKPADNVPRYDVSIRTGYSLAFEVREALGFAVRRCILQWRQTTAGSIIDPAPAGGRMTSMD
jgi:hypothetical protein